MNIMLVPRNVRDLDSVLGLIMMTGVIIAACAVLYLLGHHHHHKRKARKKRDHESRHGRHDGKTRD